MSLGGAGQDGRGKKPVPRPEEVEDGLLEVTEEEAARIAERQEKTRHDLTQEKLREGGNKMDRLEELLRQARLGQFPEE